MAKIKAKIATLEGTSEVNNTTLAQYFSALLAGELKADPTYFTLTQKPKVQEVKSPRAK